MHQFSKHFTLDEARALLPELRRQFSAIHGSKKKIEEAETRLGGTLDETGGDAGGPEADKLARAMADLHAALHALSRRGIQIKDIERGLVDFPSIRDGREVFLCWELEEDDIEFWHDLEAGFAGRERL